MHAQTLIFLVLIVKHIEAQISSIDLSCTSGTGSDLKYSINSDPCANIYTPASCQLIYAESNDTLPVAAGKNTPRSAKCYSLDNGQTLSEDVRKIATASCAQFCGYCCLTSDYNCKNSATSKTNCSSLSRTNCTNPSLTATLAKDCPAICGLCTYISCVDTNVNCPTWVKNGFCGSSFYTSEQKKQFCGRSCSLC